MPVTLGYKEGLALLNGTQVMTALGIFAVIESYKLYHTANVSAALMMETVKGHTAAFDRRIHAIRPHPGQVSCAEAVSALLEGSGNVDKGATLQDAYSLRCVPQVHGATYDALNYVKNVLQTELNSVTDNPLVFPDDDEVLSGGNFHGQPLALALDFLAIALSELANISERRIEQLVNPQLSGLAPFLVQNSGLNSGLMIAQYTAASLVSENKIYASPASVDSIPCSANQEDHVSMGSISARKLSGIIENVRHVLAIELMCSAQAIDLSGNTSGLAKRTRSVYDAIRAVVPILDKDRELYLDINKIASMIDSGEILKGAEYTL
jgi:histidine ammonia-lyase